MTFERKIFARGTGKKCGGCNWEATVLYRIGRDSEDELCAACLVDRIIEKGYHIRGED